MIAFVFGGGFSELIFLLHVLLLGLHEILDFLHFELGESVLVLFEFPGEFNLLHLKLLDFAGQVLDLGVLVGDEFLSLLLLADLLPVFLELPFEVLDFGVELGLLAA